MIKQNKPTYVNLIDADRMIDGKLRDFLRFYGIHLSTEANENACVTVIRCRAVDDGSTLILARKLRADRLHRLIAVTEALCTREEAVKAGFFSAITYKPDAANPNDFRMKLMLMIRNAKLDSYVTSLGYTGRWVYLPDSAKQQYAEKPSGTESAYDSAVDFVAIGASSGGTEALTSLVCALPQDFPCVVIVQHMPKEFTGMFAENLNRKSAVEVREARDGDFIKRGTAYIAPGDLHTTVIRASSGYAGGPQSGYILQVRDGEKISGHRPSVDALFSSAADSAGASAIGVILTGMGADGAKGLLEMRRRGAFTIGQDKESCVVYGMPCAAYNAGAVALQLPLSQIADELIRRCKPSGADSEVTADARL